MKFYLEFGRNSTELRPFAFWYKRLECVMHHKSHYAH